MIKIEVPKMIDALKIVLPGVNKGSVELEDSDCVLFANDKITTYNGITSVSKPFPFDNYKFCVKAIDLFNLISKINKPFVDIDVDSIKNKLTISAGKIKAALKLRSTDNFEKYISKITLGEQKSLPNNFVNALKIVPISNNIVSELQGVAIIPHNDKTFMISTDRFRISTKELDGNMETLLLNDSSLANVFKIGIPNKYSVSGFWVNFFYADGTIYSVGRKSHTNYPGDNILSALEKFNEIEPVLNDKLPADFVNAVSRVNVLSGISEDSNDAISSEHVISITISKTGLKVYAENAGGSAEELVVWETPVNLSDDFETVVNVPSLFISEVAKKSMNFKLVDRGNGKYLMIFFGNGYIGLVSTLTKCKEK